MKRFGIGILVLIGIIGAAWLALPRLVSKDMLRSRLEAALSERSGREVVIGDVGLALRPLPRVRATDLQIGRIDPAGSTGSDQRIEIRSLDLALALRPLLRREVEVVSATLDGLVVDVFLPEDPAGAGPEDGGVPEDGRRGAAGSGSGAPDGVATESGDGRAGSDAGSAPGGGSGARDPGTGGVTVRIESLSLRDAEVRVHRGGAEVLEMTGIREDLAAEIAIDGVVKYSGRTEVPNWKLTTPTGSFGHGLPLVLEKSLRYDPNAGSLRIESADLDLAGLPMSLSGSVSGLTGPDANTGAPDPVLDFEFSGGPGRIENIVGLLPSAWVSRTGGLTSSGSVSVRGWARGPVGPGAEPDFSLDVTLGDGRIAGGGLPAVIEALTASLEVGPDAVVVETLSARAGSSSLSARGRIDEYRTLPRIDLALDGTVDLALVTALQKTGTKRQGSETAAPELSGQADLAIVVRGTVPPDGDPSRTLEPFGTIALRDVDVRGIEQPVEGMTGTAAVRGTALEANGISFRIGESDLTVDGTVQDFWKLDPQGFGTPGTTRCDLRLRSRLLDLDALAPAESGQASAGSGNGPGSAGRSGSDPAPGSPAGSRGSGSAVGPGGTAPTGVELFAVFLSRLDGPISLGIETTRVRKLDWKNVEARGALDSGRIRIDAMNLEVFGGSVATNGDVDLRDPKNPRFDLDLSASGLEAGRFFTDNPGLSKLSGLGGFVQGVLDFTANAEGGLDEAFQLDLSTLTSLGNVEMEEGSITGHPIQTALATYLGQSDIQTLPIRDWLQPFRVRNGRVEFEKVMIRAGDFTLSGSGWSSIAGEVRLDADLLVPANRTAALRSKLPKVAADVLFGSDGGAVLVPVRVSGPAKKPAVQLDDARLTDRARSRAQQELDSEKRKLEEKVRAEREALERKLAEDAKKKAKDVIGGLLPGGAGADSSRGAPADSVAGNLEEEVKGLLKGIFKK